MNEAFVTQVQKVKALRQLAQKLADSKEPRANFSGVPEAAAPLVALGMTELMETAAPVFVVPDELHQRTLKAAWQTITERPLITLRPLPPDFTDAEVLNREPELLLNAQLLALAEFPGAGLIISAPALYDDLPSPEAVDDHSLRLALGEDRDLDVLQQQLTELVYERVEQVDAAGQFAWRGDILDVSLADPYEVEPYLIYRLSFFDTEVDSIRRVDPATQRSIEELDRVVIPPARILLMDRAEAELLARRIRDRVSAYRAERIKDGAKPAELDRMTELAVRDSERLEQGMRFPGLARWQMLLERPQYHFLDFTKAAKRPLFLFDMGQVFKRLDAVQADWHLEVTRGLEQGRFLPEAENLRLSRAEVGRRIDRYSGEAPLFSIQQLHTSAGALPAAADVRLKILDSESYLHRFSTLIADLKEYLKTGYHVILGADSSRTRENLNKSLLKEGVDVPVVRTELSRGFHWPQAGLLLLASQELVGREAKKRRRKSEGGVPIEFFSDLAVGDLVVHEDHGIGKFEGINTLDTSTGRKDYLTITYAQGDQLFLPMEQLSQIQKYLGSGETVAPKLSRLGGGEWERQKNRARESIKELAFDLVDLYAKRRAAKGHAFGPDTVFQEEFEARFPYEETEDQLRAEAEIKKDMESRRVMDRLLCGDVGFGKTEIAFRALFKAVVDGKQAALLAPTTVLAQQHYENFLERMGEMPIQVRLLSRFVPLKERREILKETKRGQVDLLIGTHRLLSKDVEFADLGLLVVDEEQRFGVGHKEELKEQYPNIDVLSLTATPIPRTLHMSLSGIRDISILEAGPEDRRPVQTYVLEYDEEIIHEAILREVERGGQVFYLLNNTRMVEKKARELMEKLPGLRAAHAHGQMHESRLERVIKEFIDGEFDVLVCTTIIENGIDLPNVNTMIVENADRLGLAQLYQIRGRVGRSGRQAYAYITYRPDKVLTEDAQKRLAVIRDYTELGSGFKIALRDLEVRGAGNLLGGEQHGHMAAIGYELYCRMLDEHLKEAMGEPVEAAGKLDPKIELSVDALIPESYMRDPVQRMAIYRRVMSLENHADLIDLTDELIDRYGDPPESVLTLLDLAYVRSQAIRLRIGQIKRRPQEIVMIFADGYELPMAAISELMATPEAEHRLFFSAAGTPQLAFEHQVTTDKKALSLLKQLFLSAEKAEK